MVPSMSRAVRSGDVGCSSTTHSWPGQRRSGGRLIAYGHVHGDRVLQSVASGYGSVLRPGEVLVRLGGDEFALLLGAPDAQSRLRRAAVALKERAPELGIGSPDGPTVSGGWVRIARGTRPALDSIYALADRALYAAKRAGGDRIHEVDSTEAVAAHGGLGGLQATPAA